MPVRLGMCACALVFSAVLLMSKTTLSIKRGIIGAAQVPRAITMDTTVMNERHYGDNVIAVNKACLYYALLSSAVKLLYAE